MAAFLRKIIILLCALLLVQVQAQWGRKSNNSSNMKYYDLLGIKKDATDAQIKKAFRKKAQQYHPDKNLDDPETAKAKFQEISAAYETLSDPDKRHVYDYSGEEGVQRKERYGDKDPFQEFQFDNIFDSFFNGKFTKGKREKTKDWDDWSGFSYKKHTSKEKRQRHPSGLFQTSANVKHLDIKSSSQFYKRKEIWAIYFYSPKITDCLLFEKEWIELADDLVGIVQIAAVNCDKEEALCDEFDVNKMKAGNNPVPSLIIFKKERGDEGHVWKGAKHHKALKIYIEDMLANNVQLLSEDNLEKFLAHSQEKYHVIIFSKQEKTPAAYKKLSTEFKDYILFGEIRNPSERILKRFSIFKAIYKNLPWQIVICKTIDCHEADKCHGDRYYEPTYEQLKATIKLGEPRMPTKFMKLTEKKFKHGLQCSDQTQNICVIFFGVPTKEMQSVIHHYKNDAIHFTHIGSNDPGFHMLRTHFGSERLVLFKAKRKKYMPLKNEYLTKELLDGVLDGQGDWIPTKEMQFYNLVHDEL